jgi:sortase A
MKKIHLPKAKSLSLFLVLLIVIAGLIFWWLHLYNDSNRHQIAGDNANENSQSARQTTGLNDVHDLGSYYINIPKLNISAPIIQGVDPTDEKKYDQALEDGVAQMTGTPLPGTGEGNTFIYGHSSSDAKGKYAEIFAGLDNLKFGDKIDIHFKDTDYQYWVFEKKFIEKTDLSVLEQAGDERLTLMTCWPIGTDDRRLIVVAKRK